MPQQPGVLVTGPCGFIGRHLKALPQKYESHLDRVSTGSGSDLVQSSEPKILREYCMPIIDQVVTAPCTDPIQQCVRLLRAKSHLNYLVECAYRVRISLEEGLDRTYRWITAQLLSKAAKNKEAQNVA
jgi:hypothetical protein